MITNKNDFIKQKMDFENYVKTAPVNEQNILKQAFNMYEKVFDSVYHLKIKEPLRSVIESDKTYSNPLEYAYKYFEVKFLNEIDKAKNYSVYDYASTIKILEAKDCFDLFCNESKKLTENEEEFYEDMYLAFTNLDVESMVNFNKNDVKLCRETFAKLVNAEPFNDETEKDKNIIKEKDSLENKIEKDVDVNKKDTDKNVEETYDDCDDVEA